MQNEKTSVVIVDDHQMVRDGFLNIVNSSDKYEVVGAFSDVRSAIESALLESVQILITDISLDDEANGFALVEYVRDNNPECKTIIVSMYENSLYLQQAQSFGVNGFIHKREASETLLKALRSIDNGEDFFSTEHHSQLTSVEEALSTYNKLFPKEKEVFLLLARGLHTKEIAFELNVAVKTIHAHRLRLYHKFNFTSSMQFTKFALLNRIIDHHDLVS